MSTLSSRIPPHILANKAAYIAAAGLVPLAYWAISDYQAWRGLPPGGVPYNLYGWGLQHFALIVRAKHKPRDTKPFEDPELLKSGPCSESILRRSFLKISLAQRSDARPEMYPWAVPHRQKTQANTAQMRAEQLRFMDEVAARAGVQIDTSKLENYGPALYALDKDGTPMLPQAVPTKGEFAHLHQFDGSVHIILSWKDAKTVMDLGWGERHPLGGDNLPLAYTLVYAPRNEAELDIWKGILEASVAYMGAQN